jgi:hypothetical protein
MHHSASIKNEAHTATRQKWQEPMILVERSLNASAQGPGPVFGPLSGTGTTGPTI